MDKSNNVMKPIEFRLKEIEVTVLMDDYLSALTLLSTLISDMNLAKEQGQLKLSPNELVSFMIVATHVLYKNQHK